MSQLPLNLIPQLIYTAQSFYVHHGVQEISERISLALQNSTYHLFILEGGSRSGKTHLALYLHSLAAKANVFPRIIEGHNFHTWLKDSRYSELKAADELLVIDDADVALQKMQPGSSGPFVAMIEHLRKLGACIVFTSTAPLAELPCDAHIMSRIREGSTLPIAAPAEEDFPHLLNKMATQRGFKFDARKADFLFKRLGRSIQSLETYLNNLKTLSENTGENIRFNTLNDAI